MIIKLEGLDFFAQHGYYEQERAIGNKYTINIEIEVANPTKVDDDDLSATVNYEIVYSTIAKIMDQPTKLLETLAHKINQSILEQFSIVIAVESTVSKHNPPIKGVCKMASVQLKSVQQ